MDALKSFCSEENAKELIQALKGSSLSGERADIGELIDTIEIAERVNENSKPTKDMIFMNEKTAENCEIFTLNTERATRASDGARALDDTIQKTKELSLRGREERNLKGLIYLMIMARGGSCHRTDADLGPRRRRANIFPNISIHHLVKVR